MYRCEEYADHVRHNLKAKTRTAQNHIRRAAYQCRKYALHDFHSLILGRHAVTNKNPPHKPKSCEDPPMFWGQEALSTNILIQLRICSIQIQSPCHWISAGKRGTWLKTCAVVQNAHRLPGGIHNAGSPSVLPGFEPYFLKESACNIMIQGQIWKCTDSDFCVRTQSSLGERIHTIMKPSIVLKTSLRCILEYQWICESMSVRSHRKMHYSLKFFGENVHSRVWARNQATPRRESKTHIVPYFREQHASLRHSLRSSFAQTKACTHGKSLQTLTTDSCFAASTKIPRNIKVCEAPRCLHHLFFQCSPPVKDGIWISRLCGSKILVDVDRPLK